MASTWLIVAAALGVDYGWQPLPQGGYEYVIQLEPQALDALRAGQDIGSVIPADLGDVRRYRITVGRGTPPGRAEPAPLRDSAEDASGPVEVAALQPLIQAAPNVETLPGAPPPVPLPYEPRTEVQPASDWQPFHSPPRPAADPQTAVPTLGAHGPTDLSQPAQPHVDLAQRRVSPQELRPRERTQLRPADVSRLPMPIPPVAAGTALSPTFSSQASFAPAPRMQPISPASAAQVELGNAGAGSPRASIGLNQQRDTSRKADDQAWFPLVVASIVLFASLGSNLYLGWLTWSFRERCRRLAGELRRLRFSGSPTGV
ncbi:MAG: hypothetical protein K1X74_16000 [Pirellulales bacterium]|nr:hypothetical protein [Pirellulales bacterium]